MVARGKHVAGMLLCAMLVMSARPLLGADASVTYSDSPRDAVARPTDPGAVMPFDPEAHRLIELREMTIGAWVPDDPEVDLFEGEFKSGGDFGRLDLAVNGLVNPPGSADPLTFDPFAYGNHPIYGFVEIDMDHDVRTGGELDAPQYRYLGNIARFGGKVSREAFRDRVAVDESAFDDDILTPPLVERHGEEFHLALLGRVFALGEIDEIAGNGDAIFDEGETWHLKGPFFHRAHAYEAFSFVEGGRYPGEYAPNSDLQFQHDVEDDVTRVSLVFPLNNVGAGLMHGQLPQPPNHDPSDQASIREALLDLQDSALFLEQFPTGLPAEDIIIDWAGRDPDDHLDPTDWDITVLLGTSYTEPNPWGLYFVWTDVYPNVVRGDVDGSGERDHEDEELIEHFIEAEDASDGLLDETVEIRYFAEDFSVFDLNYDGVVDLADLLIVELDADGDGDDDDDVDLADFAVFQQCFSQMAVAFPECSAMALGGDDWIELDDFRLFVESLTGPDDD